MSKFIIEIRLLIISYLVLIIIKLTPKDCKETLEWISEMPINK